MERLLTQVRKLLSLSTVLALVGSQITVRPCLSETVSPSPKTRGFSAPKDDYFSQVTKGHPFRWFDRDMAIRVLIKPGTAVRGFKLKFEEILRNSFQEWEANSSSKIKFQYVTKPPADITCQFVVDLPKEEPSVAGITHYQTSPHHMDVANISIKTTSKIAPITDDEMRATCLHEIGHALGLVNHSPDPHDIMYPFLTQQRALSTRDINTIKLLYEFKPPEPIIELASKPQNDPNYPYPWGNIVLSSDDYDAYTKAIASELLKHHPAFPARPMLECRVSFLVDATGKIFNYRIFQGSANNEFDQKVLSNLLSSLPLPPPPARLLKNKWSKVPIAVNFRSDAWVVPYVEPDANQSEWLNAVEEPSPDQTMKDLEKEKIATPKVIDPNLEPWIISVTQKAQSAWKIEGSGKTEVVVGIRNNGRIAHLVIVQSSKNEAFDKSVLDACMSAEPYPAAPNSSQDTIEVNMLFEH
jgi:TonB family protein